MFHRLDIDSCDIRVFFRYFCCCCYVVVFVCGVFLLIVLLLFLNPSAFTFFFFCLDIYCLTSCVYSSVILRRLVSLFFF